MLFLKQTKQTKRKQKGMVSFLSALLIKVSNKLCKQVPVIIGEFNLIRKS